ncbi:MAG TPA: hypothetical protein VEH84_15755 [Alphaproteobacteria bacterium]|nr:hypothetical protein [Alphaproteobacteria bacterium]
MANSSEERFSTSNPDQARGMSPEEKAAEFHQKGGVDRKNPSGDVEANRRNQSTHEGPIK